MLIFRLVGGMWLGPCCSSDIKELGGLHLPVLFDEIPVFAILTVGVNMTSSALEFLLEEKNEP
jgi:hypothetical protein